MDGSTHPEVHRRTLAPPSLEPVAVGGGFIGCGLNADPVNGASTTVENGTRTVSVVIEGTSNALSRIFLLLAMLSLVPVATRSELSGRNTLVVRLSFFNVGETRIDKLCRKLLQLTETISVYAMERSIGGQLAGESVVFEG